MTYSECENYATKIIAKSPDKVVKFALIGKDTAPRFLLVFAKFNGKILSSIDGRSYFYKDEEFSISLDEEDYSFIKTFDNFIDIDKENISVFDFHIKKYNNEKFLYSDTLFKSHLLLKSINTIDSI